MQAQPVPDVEPLVPSLNKARRRVSRPKGSVSVVDTTQGIGRTLPRRQSQLLDSFACFLDRSV